MERDRPAGEGGAGAGGFAERLMLEGLWGTAGPSADLYTSTHTLQTDWEHTLHKLIVNIMSCSFTHSVV